MYPKAGGAQLLLLLYMEISTCNMKQSFTSQGSRGLTPDQDPLQQPKCSCHPHHSHQSHSQEPVSPGVGTRSFRVPGLASSWSSASPVRPRSLIDGNSTPS